MSPNFPIRFSLLQDSLELQSIGQSGRYTQNPNWTQAPSPFFLKIPRAPRHIDCFARHESRNNHYTGDQQKDKSSFTTRLSE